MHPSEEKKTFLSNVKSLRLKIYQEEQKTKPDDWKTREIQETLNVSSSSSFVFEPSKLSEVQVRNKTNDSLKWIRRQYSEKQHTSVNLLRQAQAQLVQTKEVAADTLKNLTEQRETLQKSKLTGSNMNQELKHSNRLLSKMSQWWRR